MESTGAGSVTEAQDLLSGFARDDHNRVHGILVENEHIRGNDMWRRIRLDFPLEFRNCVFLDDVDMSQAVLTSISFTQCRAAAPDHGVCLASASVAEGISIDGCDFGWLDLSLVRVSGDVTVSDCRLGQRGCPDEVSSQRQPSLDLERAELGVLALKGVDASDRASLFEVVAHEISISESSFGTARRNVHAVPSTVVLDNSALTTYATLWLSQVQTRNALQLGPAVKVYGDIRLVDARIGTALRIGADTDWSARTEGIPSRSAMTLVEGGVVNLLRAHVGSRTELAVAVPATIGSSDITTPPMILNDGSFGDLSIFHLVLAGVGASVCLDGTRYSRFTTPHLRRSAESKPTIACVEEIDVVRAYAKATPPPESSSRSLYLRQPYSELAQALARNGRSDEARRVLMRMHADERLFGSLGVFRGAWNAVSGLMIGHGYALHRSAIPLVLCILSAFLVISSGKAGNEFLATQPSVAIEALSLEGSSSAKGFKSELAAALDSSQCTRTYPCLQPFVYTLDVVVPVIEFDQTAFWQPRGDWWGRAALIAAMVLSWIFVTLLIAGLSASGRRDHDVT